MEEKLFNDFMVKYASEEEEMLVLIQDNPSASKPGFAAFWTASVHALAVADVRSGRVISGECGLHWPLTDEEVRAGDYHKLINKGQICRVKVRSRKDNAAYTPQWYLVEVLEKEVACPELEKIWAEYTKPVLLKDAVLGTLTLNREIKVFKGTCTWLGKKIRISLDVEIEKKETWTQVTDAMKKLLADQETWDKTLRAMAAKELTELANDWLADDDESDRDPDKDPITREEFAQRITLTDLSVSFNGNISAWFGDDDMFYGHDVTVYGSLKDGPTEAVMQG